MKRTTIQEINDRGFSNGWHAEQLQAEAQRENLTMADMFSRKIANSSAFNVPAQAIKASSEWITYRFLDGSESKFPNNRTKRK